MTQDTLRVSPHDVASPYPMVQNTQLDAVLAVLDRHKVRYAEVMHDHAAAPLL